MGVSLDEAASDLALMGASEADLAQEPRISGENLLPPRACIAARAWRPASAA